VFQPTLSLPICLAAPRGCPMWGSAPRSARRPPCCAFGDQPVQDVLLIENVTSEDDPHLCKVESMDAPRRIRTAFTGTFAHRRKSVSNKRPISHVGSQIDPMTSTTLAMMHSTVGRGYAPAGANQDLTLLKQSTRSHAREGGEGSCPTIALRTTPQGKWRRRSIAGVPPSRWTPEMTRTEFYFTPENL
jgi:hypothetical protein